MRTGNNLNELLNEKSSPLRTLGETHNEKDRTVRLDSCTVLVRIHVSINNRTSSFTSKTNNYSMKYEKEIEWLKVLEEKFRQISSDWNGEDKSFQSGGQAFTEEEASQAEDVADSADSLIKLLENLQF